MPENTVNLCLIGQKFMGRAHSNAYLKVDKFFDLPVRPVMHTVCGRDRIELERFARRWGWQTASVDWRGAIANPQIDLVDVTTPNNQHLDMVLAALEAGKHVACEKPLAGSLGEARQMRDAARKHPHSKTFVWYSYRRVPAVAFAHQLVKSGRIGRIYHIRAYYLQDWAGPDVPLIWRFNKEAAGSGSLGDLGAHVIDMARFVSGEEITAVSGAIAETFIRERPLPSVGSAGGLAGGSKAGEQVGTVDVDDAVLFLARFTGGAVASFEATRFATGYQNRNGVEIHGERGAISIDFEDMDWLRFFDRTEDRATQGWRRINVTHAPDHPYAHAWWPDAHGLGYEHTFINQAADMLNVLGGKPPVVPLPDFEDAYKTQQVLEAVTRSAAERRPVDLGELD